MPEAHIVYENEKNKYFPLAEPFRYERSSFWNAGIDSLSQPPTQDEDGFLKLDNILPVTKGTLQRRWGYAAFSALDFAPTRMVEYQSDETGVRRILLADAAKIESIKEDGTADNTSVLTVTATPRIVVSRDWGFVINGASTDLKKVGDTTGTWTAENWGISGPQVSSGPFSAYAGTVADIGGAHAWVNPTNAQGAPDGVYATNTVGVTTVTNSLRCTNYGFALAGTYNIDGIQVIITGHGNLSASSQIVAAVLNYGGAAIGSIRQGNLPQTTGSLTLGGTSDNWGTSLSVSQINDSTFGVAFSVNNNSLAGNEFFIDAVQLIITVSGGTALTVGATGAGSITLSVGRKYFYVYRNSSTGHIGPLSDVSVSTGPLTSKNVPLSAITASPDSQVDFVDILATADGGDETLLYYLDSVANGVTTYTDNTTEATLLLNTTYLETDQFGNEIGVADNSIPPVASTGIKHRGRLYLANGQYLYFSKSLGELTTSTGFIAGRYEECWPADYVLDISAGAETISALLSDGMILYIGTERHVRRLIGDGPLNYTKPDVTFAEVGVLNQEVWKVVYHEGMPTGVLWMTPDFRIIWSDFNTYRDVSPPVQGNTLATGYLSSINQSAAATACRAEIFTSGPYDFYFLAIPTGANTVADTILVFNIKTQKWFRWTLADKVESILFNVNASGVPQLLFTADTNEIYRFGTGLSGITLETQDRVGNTPVAITSTVQTVWLPLGDSAMRKSLNNLKITTGDTALTTTIEAASTAADFVSPFTLVTARTLTADAYSDLRLFPLGEKARKHFYRYTFTSASSDIEVLDTFAQEVFPVHKF